MLYSAHSRVGRGNLMLRYSFPIFCWILEALRVEWQNSTPRFASTPERRNGNIHGLSKYFISSSGDRTHNQSILQSHLVPLRHDWPQEDEIILPICNQLHCNTNEPRPKKSVATYAIRFCYWYSIRASVLAQMLQHSLISVQ